MPLSLSLKIRQKVFLLVIGLFAATGLFAAVLLWMVGNVRIQGPLYRDIILSKDLVADILPPPAYLVESMYYLHALSAETNTAVLEDGRSQLERLEKEYRERHAFWQVALEPPATRAAFLDDSRIPALAFFRTVRERYLPALAWGDRAGAYKILKEEVEPFYKEHRKAIDRVVALANEQAAQVEGQAARGIARVQRFFLIGVPLLVILMVFLTLRLVRTIQDPLALVTEQMREIEGGDGDLTRRIAEGRRDEFGELARSFNGFVEKIRSMVGLTRENLGATHGASREIHDHIGRNAKAVEAMAETSAAVRGSTREQHENFSALEGLAREQAEQIATLLSNLRGIASRIEDLGRVVGRQSSSVNEMGATIEEQAANIRTIAGVAQKADASGAALAAAASDGKELLARSATAVGKMIETTRAVASFANIISGVAGQTNLLAMNAAIEAAHAGESGKGFAVVADEIRKLADQSRSEAVKVKALLREVDQVEGRAREELEATAAAFDRIAGESASVGEVVRQVRQAMDEQNLANGEMVAAVGEIQETTALVKGTGDGILVSNQAMDAAAGHLEGKTSEIRAALIGLRELADRVSSAMDRLESGMAEIRSGTRSVEGLAAGQEASMQSLRSQLERFRVERAGPERALLET
ncbi:MAG: methyl-accepting chemotaxis protein [Spirochaetes bacterium]|nr:methyl-accepting chemotaxis protein [Spirochaetota bacterium]